MSENEERFEYREEFDGDVWDEEQWEFFMQEADRRAEEYLKKIEDELLSKKESLDGEEEGYRSPDERSSEEEQWKQGGDGWCDGDGKDSFRHLPVWRTTYGFACEVQRFVEGLRDTGEKKREMQELAENSLAIPAKIAGGHGMGYDREVLEGNIAYCKRALKAAEQCAEALERIRIKENPTPEMLNLYGYSLRVRNEVRAWIEELRRKIWWR